MERKLRAVVLLEIHLLFVFFLHGQSSADNENGKLTHRVTHGGHGLFILVF